MTTADNDKSQSGAPRGRRWVLPLLIVSLGLNLLFVGLVAGRMWAHLDGPRGEPHRIVTRAVKKFSGELPEAKKKRADELLQRQRERNKAVKAELRKARKEAREAALATTYDEEKLAAALARFREIRTGQHEAMHEMVLDLLKDLSLEERKILMRYIRAEFRPHRRPGHRRDKRGNGDAPRGQ